jgi:hypothetical protein
MSSSYLIVIVTPTSTPDLLTYTTATTYTTVTTYTNSQKRFLDFVKQVT